MSLSNVNIVLGTSAAAVVAGTDATSGIIVSGVAIDGEIALNECLGPFYSLQEVEDRGITAAYDTTNTCVAHKHIADFFAEKPNGAELYVMVVAKTVSMADLVNPTLNYAKALIDFSEGKIRTIAISRTPAAGYAPVFANQLDADIWAAITQAKLLRAHFFNRGIPVLTLIEARNFQGTISSLKNLAQASNADAEFVALMIGQDADYAASNAHAAKYAAVGHLLGRVASIQVQRNIGRVQDGPRATIANPGLSNGQPLVTSAGVINFNDIALGTLNDYHYIFFRKIAGKTGAYYNNDYCACPVERKYNRISRTRPIDKAVRITNAQYTNQLLDDPELDAETGKLNAAVIKDFQATIEEEISNRMITTTTGVAEISGVSAFADPAQNVVTTNKIKVTLSIVPKGMIDGIDVELAYVNSLNS